MSCLAVVVVRDDEGEFYSDTYNLLPKECDRGGNQW